MVDWYTVEDDERLVAAWPDAPISNVEVCGMILDVAKEQVLDYAPAFEDLDDYEDGDEPPAEPPTRYVYAQLQQAVNLWNAGRVSSDGDTGMDGYTFTPRPLDKTIRQIIRPTSGVPNAGG